jgi:triphosphoribosyl-dephospho-CoA synthase
VSATVRAAEIAGDATVSADDLALAGAAVAAMRDELELHPKPGLVSPIDSGAHRDMDFDLMCRSAEALRQPFARLAAAGRRGQSFDTALAPLGRDAERAMLQATGGVNTHRGAIFSLGLIVAAIARTRAIRTEMAPAAIQNTLVGEWGRALEAHADRGEQAASHGGLVRQRTGAGGARSEAARGFPGVFRTGIPTYREALARGLAERAARVQTLFALMAEVDDTTVLYRGGVEAGAFVRHAAMEFLAAGGCDRDGWVAEAERLHRTFVARNLSPGGCADLLAATLLVARTGERTGVHGVNPS